MDDISEHDDALPIDLTLRCASVTGLNVAPSCMTQRSSPDETFPYFPSDKSDGFDDNDIIIPEKDYNSIPSTNTFSRSDIIISDVYMNKSMIVNDANEYKDSCHAHYYHSQISTEKLTEDNVSFGNTTYAVIDLPDTPEVFQTKPPKSMNSGESGTHYAEIELGMSSPPDFTPPPPPISQPELTNQRPGCQANLMAMAFGIPPAFCDTGVNSFVPHSVHSNGHYMAPVHNSSSTISEQDSYHLSFTPSAFSDSDRTSTPAASIIDRVVSPSNACSADSLDDSNPYGDHAYVARILSFDSLRPQANHQGKFDSYTNVLGACTTSSANASYCVDSNSSSSNGSKFDSAYYSPTIASSTNQDNMSISEFVENPVYLVLPPLYQEEDSVGTDQALLLLYHDKQSDDPELDLILDDDIPEPSLDIEYDDVESTNRDYYSYADHGENANSQDEEEADELYDDVIPALQSNTNPQHDVFYGNTTEMNNNQNEKNCEEYLEMESPKSRQREPAQEEQEAEHGRQRSGSYDSSLYMPPSSPPQHAKSRAKVDLFGRVCVNEPYKPTEKKGKNRPSLLSDSTFVVRSEQMQMMEENMCDWSAKDWVMLMIAKISSICCVYGYFGIVW